MAYTMVYRAGHRETRITELGYNEERGCWQYSENFGDSAYTYDITRGDPMIDRRQQMALQLRRRNEWLNMLLGASKVWVGLYA